MESIESFCDRHYVCCDGKKWALENCSTMDDVWKRAKPEWLIWVATRAGVLDDKTLRLFACWCVRHVWRLLEERSRNAVLVAEKFVNGEAMEDDLDAARAAARVAACSAARVAARAASCNTAWDAARAAARKSQAKWLRENAKPNFKLAGGVK